MTLRLSRKVMALQRTEIRRIFEAAPADAIQLGLGQPDLASPDVVGLGGIAAIAAGRTGYSATAGTSRLRELLAARHGARPEEVLVTVGSQEAMYLGCMALADPGDEILYPDPGYPAYPVVADLVGARGVPYPVRAEGGFRVDPDELLGRLSGRTRVAILCSPSNPTGAVTGRTATSAIVTELGRRGVPWISDEIYAAFDWRGAFVSPRSLDPGGGLVVSSVSKDVAMAGWRIGWTVGPEEVIRRLTAAHQYVVTCASTVSQLAAEAAFSPAGERSRTEVVERFRRRREAMAEGLAQVPDVRFEKPDGAFYFFVDVSAHGDSRAVARRLLERCRVVTIPGEAFGAGGAGYLRISFAAPIATIREGLARIAAELS